MTAALSGFSDATLEGIVVADALVEAPTLALPIASFGDTVVVTASRTEVWIVDAPVTTSVISAATLETTASSNIGDVLRSVPGVNVVQLSARDVQVTSRQSTGTLANSQLVLVDGRSVYLDFFGLFLWDLVPANTGDIEQIEVVRGPASATWGANAMTGEVNVITKSPRESVGTTVTVSGGWMDRDAGSTIGQSPVEGPRAAGTRRALAPTKLHSRLGTPKWPGLRCTQMVGFDPFTEALFRYLGSIHRRACRSYSSCRIPPAPRPSTRRSSRFPASTARWR